MSGPRKGTVISFALWSPPAGQILAVLLSDARMAFLSAPWRVLLLDALWSQGCWLIAPQRPTSP